MDTLLDHTYLFRFYDGTYLALREGKAYKVERMGRAMLFTRRYCKQLEKRFADMGFTQPVCVENVLREIPGNLTDI